MQSITNTGRCVYRTPLVTWDEAERFARSVEGRGRGEVMIHERKGTSRRRWWVELEPKDPREIEAIRQKCQMEREKRAAEGFRFVLTENRGRPYFLCEGKSGQVYELTEKGCDCPDYQFRCRSNGLRCKHILALLSAIDRGDVGSFVSLPKERAE